MSNAGENGTHVALKNLYGPNEKPLRNTDKLSDPSNWDLRRPLRLSLAIRILPPDGLQRVALA
ncbi:hypothetical protein D3C72_1921430 [compost metagenome]